MKISTLIITMIVSVMFVTIFGMYYANIAQNHGISYDDTSFNYFNKTSDLQGQVEDINQTLTKISSAESGTVDILGGFFKAGYMVIKDSFTSITIFTGLTNDAIDNLELGSGTNIFKITLLMIIVITFFFIIISLLVGKEV